MNLASVSFFNLPNQAIHLLASITPTSWDVELVDESRVAINFDTKTDLVALTALSALAPRAYEIAGKFRARGVATIMGGIHASVMPEEAARYVDSVVIGEADEIWPEILRDFERGEMKSIYRPSLPSSLDLLETREIPKTHRVRFIDWLPISLRVTYMQVGRGCPHNCEFCSVTKISGRTIRTKSIAYIVGKIAEEKAKGMDLLFFSDDNIIANKRFARDLFSAIKPLGIRWVSQADIRIADEDILDSAVGSGMVGVFLGLESISEDTLGDGVGRVKQRMRANYESAIKRLHDRGVNVMGGLIFGFDFEREGSYDETVEWAIANKIDIAQFTILTPLPGTDLFERIHKEDRLASIDWSRYDLMNNVLRGEGAEDKNLELVIRKAFRQFYSYRSQIRRFRFSKSLFDLGVRLANLQLRWISQLF
ncbi:MAG: hypothetical protein A2568_02385 [Candidatus Yanofskybacteria bacterium RIFOXYD1_FULL_44_17]|nr:MAG: hypothetical protein A2241_02390 [Candidatus Yanofskybacteria bacterium RIFOXYA2_FULL_45_28]OGN35749.1 MAG: hypothetical protein A2207_01605 [Candidatus Yanofskybacteria bacterium RIFOXYA1_FULL_44_17]OGN37045.1 MAG: hypothetical protein A2302_02700 [Candidatus Yanofskybacteria bacterium RIFOXYB2_FULL_44_18]OGN37078.1 MAG: hypothetical protein A2371_01125 [Candidatus Yanofskybacteria bacterium RIFOXYB1_FULL_44_29]OGN37309.1 MAG: hypothetical protein A2405_03790 [Candidatus Yanofskybacter